MDELIRDTDGRGVGRIIWRPPDRWQVLIFYDRLGGTSEKLLPNTQTGDSYFSRPSAAKEMLARHIAGLCLIRDALEKHGIG